MAARLESSDGTTLSMMMPSTPGESSDASANRLRSRTPHSSAVWPWTVRRRQWLTRRRWSNAPMVILLLPTSRASSILGWPDSSSEYKGFRAVVRAQLQEAGGIETGGGAGDDAGGLFDAHAFAARVAGVARELIQNRLAGALPPQAGEKIQNGEAPT